MKRRLFSSALLFVVSSCFLFASGSSDRTTAQLPDEMNVSVYWWGSQTRNDRTQKVLDMFVEGNPGVSIDGQFASDYWQRLATLAAGHTMPDVIQMDYVYLATYANNGLLADLTPYVENENLSVTSISPTILNTGKIDGQLYGICNGINAPALLYNKTLLDEAGIEIHNNMTMDEFVDICREVYQKTGYKTSFCYGSGITLEYMAYLLRAHHLRMYNGNSFGVNGPEDFVPLFSLLEQGINEGWHVNPSVYVERQIASIEQDCMVYGSSPDTMSWCGVYHSNQLIAAQKAAPEGVEIGITTWPSDNPKLSNFLKPSQFFCVTTDSLYPEVGVSLIDFITNSVAANNVLLGERGVPASSVVAKAISENQTVKEQEVVRYINDVVTPNCSQIDPPYPTIGSEITTLINRMAEKVLYGQSSSEEAAQQLFIKGNQIFDSAN